MNTTWSEKGIEEGIEKGRREMLRDQLEACFGPLPPSVLERLERLSVDEVIAKGKAVPRAQSLRDLGLAD